MSKIVVLGGSLIGLSTAMMLSRQGHDVNVFERDSEPLPGSPEEAWHLWERRGVVQFRLPHYLQPGGMRLLDSHLPDVRHALIRAGCITFDALATMPQTIADRRPREGDERFTTVTGHRSTIEYAIASVAENLVSVRPGVAVTGLLTGSSTAKGIPHITGVRTMEGEQISADLVIDAMGRPSKLPDWLEAIGARRPIQEVENLGIVSYSRVFRSKNGSIPPYRTGPQTFFHSFTLGTPPGDDGTWSVNVVISSTDQALKKLRDPKHWTALVAACPLHRHWLDGEPITDVLPMGSVIERYRRFVVDGVPVATGIVSVGDSWACTNPSLGRGMTIGLKHAAGTVDVVGRHLDNPRALALAHDSMTETHLTPWYRATVEADRRRMAGYRASIEGRPVPHPIDARARILDALAVAMMYDADLFRVAFEIGSVQALPEEVLARPGMVERIIEVADTHERVTPQGPSREELLRILQSERREPQYVGAEWHFASAEGHDSGSLYGR